MADRFVQVPFTVAIAAGGLASFGVTIPANTVNVAKIKVVPSIAAAESELLICQSNSYALTTAVYRTKRFIGVLIDPIEDDGTVKVERTQGYVCSYEDLNSSLQMYLFINNWHTATVTYTGTIWVDAEYSHVSSGVIVGVPDGLDARAFASGLVITTGVTALRNNATIDSAEFRAIFILPGTLELPYYDLRTAAEGGTFAHNGTTQLIITGITANEDGAQFIFTSAAAGRWYYAWRLHNSVGWSNWTDGNQYPSRVAKWVDTRDLNAADTGPPSDWDIWLEDGPASDTIVARATRPATNSDIINYFVVQVKDGSTGTWTSLYNGPDPDNIKWNGQAIPLILTGGRNSLIDATSGGFGTAARGDLVLLDVRGGTWNEQYCQWATVRSIVGNTINIDGYFRPQVLADLRVVIIKPPWAWTTGGFLGGYAGRGWWPQKKSEETIFIGDTGTTEFKTSPIVIPGAVTQPEARAWFENSYSRADDNVNHTSGLIGLPSQRLWTAFDDRRWFLPIYGSPAFATVTLDANGKPTSASANPTAGNGGNIYGVRGHFAVYPNLSGVVILRAKWTNVTIPQYTKVDPVSITREGTALFIGQMNPWSDEFKSIMWAATWGNYRNNANVRFLQGEGDSLEYLARIDAHLIGASPGYVDVARPVAGYTLEIKVGFSTGVGISPGVDMAITTCEYRLNSGAWTAIPNIARGAAITYSNAAIEGIIPTIGMIDVYHTINQGLGGWTAKLSEFEVISGIIRQLRLQSVR